MGRETREIDIQLLKAAAEGDLSQVQSLLAQGANIIVRDKDGNTPLILAAGGGHLEIVECLYGKDGAGIREALLSEKYFRFEPITARFMANLPGDERWCKEKNDINDTPLILAICNGHLAVAQYLSVPLREEIKLTQADESKILSKLVFCKQPNEKDKKAIVRMLVQDFGLSYQEILQLLNRPQEKLRIEELHSEYRTEQARRVLKRVVPFLLHQVLGLPVLGKIVLDYYDMDNIQTAVSSTSSWEEIRTYHSKQNEQLALLMGPMKNRLKSKGMSEKERELRDQLFGLIQNRYPYNRNSSEDSTLFLKDFFEKNIKGRSFFKESDFLKIFGVLAKDHLIPFSLINCTTPGKRCTMVTVESPKPPLTIKAKLSFFASTGSAEGSASANTLSPPVKESEKRVQSPIGQGGSSVNTISSFGKEVTPDSGGKRRGVGFGYASEGSGEMSPPSRQSSRSADEQNSTRETSKTFSNGS